MGFLRTLWRFRNTLIIVLTPLVLLPLPINGKSLEANCAYALCIMATFWTTEACPLAVTSLLPVILFPMLGILKADEASMAYLRQLNFLFIGGLIVAVAIEEWNLHKRMALKVLLLIGSKPIWVLFGFMLVTWFLSMWINNTSTTALMVPVAMAVADQMDRVKRETNARQADDPTAGVTEAVELVEVTSPNLDTTAFETGLDETSPNIDPTAGGTEAVELVDTTSPNLANAGKIATDATSSRPSVPISRRRSSFGKSEADYIKLRKAMLLCIPYAANIGGTTTLIGTGTNLILLGALDAKFGSGASDQVDFVSWLAFTFPVSLICLLFAWIWLYIRFLGFKNMFKASDNESAKRVKASLQQSYAELGPVSFGEMAVLGHFIVLALLWLTRDPKFISGWKKALGLKYVLDSTVAILISFSIFIFPSKSPMRFFRSKRNSATNYNTVGDGRENERQSSSDNGCRPSPPLLSWRTAQKKLAWDVVFLLGAGFSLAKACEASGLTNWVGKKVAALGDISPSAFAFIVSIVLSILTEFTSNTSTASIFIPLLSELAFESQINPLFITIPATISCSFAFSLPVATPPNAIAFSYGGLQVIDLVSTGLVLNFVCIFILHFFLNTTGVAIFNLYANDTFTQAVTGVTTLSG